MVAISGVNMQKYADTIIKSTNKGAGQAQVSPKA